MMMTLEIEKQAETVETVRELEHLGTGAGEFQAAAASLRGCSRSCRGCSRSCRGCSRSCRDGGRHGGK